MPLTDSDRVEIIQIIEESNVNQMQSIQESITASIEPFIKGMSSGTITAHSGLRPPKDLTYLGDGIYVEEDSDTRWIKNSGKLVRLG